MNEIFIYIGSSMLILWGIAHLIPTANIVKGFGDISADNKKVLAGAVIAEGLTLIFLGVLPLMIVLYGYELSVNAFIVYRTEGVFLFLMGILTIATGARTNVIWYKICPAVKTAAALLFVLGSLIL